MKHLLKLQDLTKEEILEILDLADKLKYEKNFTRTFSFGNCPFIDKLLRAKKMESETEAPDA